MKIILISNMYPSDTDRSYGIFVKNFEKSMEQTGVEFSSVCVIRGKRKTGLQKTLAYIRLHLSVTFNVLFKTADVVYAHYPLQIAPLLRFLRMFTAKSFVLNFHGSDLFCSEKVNPFFKKASEKLAQESEMLVVPSEYFKEQIVNIMKLDKEKIIVSPSAGIDFDILNRDDLKPSKERDFHIGFISRIDEEKGWDTYLKALKILKDKGALGSKKCLILGSGKQDDKKEKLIKELQLEQVVEVKGSVAQKELPGYSKNMELFVFPSERKAESLGLVGLEAMACGVPVLGSDNGGIANYIKSGENGLLFKKGDAEDLAEKVGAFFKMTKVQRMTLEEKAYDTATLYENSRVSMNLVNKLKKRFFPGDVNGKI